MREILRRAATAVVLVVHALPVPAQERVEPRFEPPHSPWTQKLDRYGDPLPDGATLRLGTLRARSPTSVLYVAFLPDGKSLWAGGSEGAIHTFDLRDGRRTGSLFLEDMLSKSDMALSRDGKRLAVVTNWKGFAVVDADTGKPLSRLKPKADEPLELYSVCFSPDGDLIATTGRDRAVRLWHAATGAEFLALRMGGREWERVWPPVFSPDGRLLASEDGEAIYVWDLEAPDRARRLPHEKKHGARPAAFTPDGKQLICLEHRETAEKAPLGGTLCEWEIVLRDVESGKKAETLKKVRSWSAGRRDAYRGWCAMRLSADGKWLLGAYGNQRVLWEVATGKVAWKIDFPWEDNGPPGRHAIDFSPDASLIAGAGKTIDLWETATGGRRLGFPDGHADEVRSLCISTDGRLAVTSDHYGSIRLWELPSAKHLRELRLSNGMLRSVVLTPDGKLVIAGGERMEYGPERIGFGGIVKVWQVADGKLLHEVKFERRVQRVAIRADGKKLAVAAGAVDGPGGPGGDGPGPPSAVHIIDLVRPQVMEASLEYPAGQITYMTALAFAKDGAHVSAVDNRATVRQWDIAAGKKLQQYSVLRKGEVPSSYAVGYDATGEWAAIGVRSRMTMREVATGKELLHIPLPEGKETYLAVSPDRRLIAAAVGRSDSNSPGELQVLDAATGRTLLKHPSDGTRQTAVAFSPDGKSVIVGTGLGTALVYDVREAYDKLGPTK
jgi:WD40 repeat protein